MFGSGVLDEGDGGVDGVEVCGGGPWFDVPVEEDDVGDVGIREQGLLLGFAWMGWGFARW